MAIECGFHACGIASAEALPLYHTHLAQWLAAGYHAGMSYMERNKEMRSDPTMLVSGAKSVISMLLGYKPSINIPHVAMYAYGEDYHERIKQMLFLLIAKIKEHYPEFEAKPCVDTVPIADKVWAYKAGLGWIGKNNLLINPELGSLCFIGELVTDAVFDAYDSPIESQCGDCTRCIENCPNGALTHRGLNSNRCTSYNTIENREDVLPQQLDTAGYVFGCDICQLACPYNKGVGVNVVVDEQREEEIRSLMEADEQTFRKLTKHSSINRIKYHQWLRNLAHAEKTSVDD